MQLVGRWTIAAAALWPAAAWAETTQLRQVLVVSRHGIRGPYGLGTEIPSAEVLQRFVRNPDVELPLSATAWGTNETDDDPDEVVSPKLTAHGYRVVELMGEYFRTHLYQDFLDATTCSSVFAYADANQRDNRTAQAFLSGLYPSCKGLLPITAETRLLFEQGQDPTATCPVCSRSVYEGITGSNDTRFILQEVQQEVQQINDLLDCCAPSVCDADDADDGSCDLNKVPTKWNGAFYQPWTDTLSDADYFSEWLLLQSVNNMTLPTALSFDKVLELAKVHETHMDLVTNEVNSANFGATLLAHMTASLEQTVAGQAIPTASGDGPRIVQPVDNQFLYYAAHDINLLYLRNILRLQWHTKGWHPHQPTLGGMLIFELHSTKDSRVTNVKRVRSLGEQLVEEDERIGYGATSSDKNFFVKAFFVTASPQQMRNAEALTESNPPDRVPIVIPLCSEEITLADGSTDVRCAFPTFKKLIGKSLKHECVADTLRPFVNSLSKADNGGGDGHAHSRILSLLLWGVAGVLSLVTLGLLLRYIIHARAQNDRIERRQYGTLPQMSA